MASTSVWYSKLESEMLLTDLFEKLSTFSEKEKTGVLISWLCNCYSDLTNSEPGKKLSSPEYQGTLLSRFIVQIRLLNRLMSQSSSDVTNEFANYFSKGFLDVFIKPSLVDNPAGSSDATYYFQVTCENVTHPLLIKKIVQFTISKLLPTLIDKLKSGNGDVVQATLGLFKALLEFYCEDLWHELILQYLLPMKHLMVSERQKSIPEHDFQSSSTKFLDLIPDTIVNTLDSDTLSLNFRLYIQNELQRQEEMNCTISKTIVNAENSLPDLVTNYSCHDSEDSFEDHEEMDMKNISMARNPIYPNWVFKYDGSDVIYSSRKDSFNTILEPEEFFEDDLFQFFIKPSESEQEFQSDEDIKSFIKRGETATTEDNSDIPTIRVYSKPVHYPQNSNENTFRVLSREETTSLGSRGSEDQGYLGPFLDALYQILKNWTRLDPDFMLVVTDIFSILASSRIPLISSMILDLSIILQPCFPTFFGIIHAIKSKLDFSIKKYPHQFVKNVWNRAAKGTSVFPEGFGIDNSEDSPSHSTTDNSFLSSPFSMLNQYSSGRSGAFLAKIFGQNTSQDNTNKILKETPSNQDFDTEDERIKARTVTLRGILFAHWMLELAAISHQQSWMQTGRNPIVNS